MKFSIDRFVLSYCEKFSQFLQRQFGIKRRTLIETSAGCCLVIILSIWRNGNTLLPAVHVPFAILTFCLLFYIFVISNWDQRDAEDRALKGLAAPEKKSAICIYTRIFFDVIIVIYILLFLVFEPIREILEIFSLLVSFWAMIYFMSVDVLPPSQEKSRQKPKEFFARKVHSN